MNKLTKTLIISGSLLALGGSTFAINGINKTYAEETTQNAYENSNTTLTPFNSLADNYTSCLECLESLEKAQNELIEKLLSEEITLTDEEKNQLFENQNLLREQIRSIKQNEDTILNSPFYTYYLSPRIRDGYFMFSMIRYPNLYYNPDMIPTPYEKVDENNDNNMNSFNNDINSTDNNINNDFSESNTELEQNTNLKNENLINESLNTTNKITDKKNEQKINMNLESSNKEINKTDDTKLATELLPEDLTNDEVKDSNKQNGIMTLENLDNDKNKVRNIDTYDNPILKSNIDTMQTMPRNTDTFFNTANLNNGVLGANRFNYLNGQTNSNLGNTNLNVEKIIDEKIDNALNNEKNDEAKKDVSTDITNTDSMKKSKKFNFKKNIDTFKGETLKSNLDSMEKSNFGFKLGNKKQPKALQNN